MCFHVFFNFQNISPKVLTGINIAYKVLYIKDLVVESEIKIERNTDNDLLTVRLIVRDCNRVEVLNLLEDLNFLDFEFVKRNFVGKTFKENKDD